MDEAVSGAASHARETRAQFVALTKSLLDRLDRNPDLMEPALRGFVHGFSSLHTDAAVAGEIVTNTRMQSWKSIHWPACAYAEFCGCLTLKGSRG